MGAGGQPCGVERDVKKKTTTKNMNSEGSDLKLPNLIKKQKNTNNKKKSKDRLKKTCDLKCLYLTVKGIIVFN